MLYKYNTVHICPLGSAVMPDLAVGHFRDFPSAPGCPLRLFGWQAWCLLPSPPVPPFPCGRATSSRAIRAPELGNANSSSIPKDAPVIPSPSTPTYCPLDTPRASPHSASTTSPALSVSPQTLPNALGPGFVVKVTRFAYVSCRLAGVPFLFSPSRCSYLVLICLQCGLADITADPSVFSRPLLQSPSHATPSFSRSSPPLPMPRVSKR